MSELLEIQRIDMSFVSGFLLQRKEYDGGCRQVDWEKATEFVQKNSSQIENVEVGLAEDFDCTSQLFWDKENGFETEEGYKFYGCSTWATPALHVEFENGDVKTFECWELGENSSFVGETGQ